MAVLLRVKLGRHVHFVRSEVEAAILAARDAQRLEPLTALCPSQSAHFAGRSLAGSAPASAIAQWYPQ